jgi:hypothetical protein
MKRLLLFLSSLILVFSFLSPVAFADENKDTQTLPDVYGDFLNSLPPSILEKLPEGALSNKAEEVGGAAQEMSSFSFLLQTALSLVGLRLGDCIKLLCSIVGILILSSICRTFSSSLKKPEIARAFSLMITLIITVTIFGTGFGYGSILSQKHTSYFHSSIIQILSCSGLVGLTSFVLLYVVRIKNLLKNQTIFGSFAFIAFVMFGCYALIDNGEFNMVTIYVTLLIAIASIINTKRDSELPLERKKFS